jgi:hypothetical protein
MEQTEYDNLCYYLTHGTPPHITGKHEQLALIRRAQNYFLQDDILYRRNKRQAYWNVAEDRNISEGGL